MKNFKLALALGTALFVASCSDASRIALDNALTNFDTSVARVNASIAADSPKLAQSCTSLAGVGSLLAQVGGGKTNAALRAVNTGITSWCQDVGDDEDIGDAIDSVSGAIADGKAAYKAATGKAI